MKALGQMYNLTFNPARQKTTIVHQFLQFPLKTILLQHLPNLANFGIYLKMVSHFPESETRNGFVGISLSVDQILPPG